MIISKISKIEVEREKYRLAYKKSNQVLNPSFKCMSLIVSNLILCFMKIFYEVKFAFTGRNHYF